MKTICLMITGGLAVSLMLCCYALSDEPKAPASRPAPTTATAPGPGGQLTDQVVAFYKALLQKEPPSIEQEKALFDVNTSALRSIVVADQHLKAADPVLLQLFRSHRDLFFPKNIKLDEIERVEKQIQITEPFRFVRNLDGSKEIPPKGFGFVMVTFSRDENSRAETTSIVFPMTNAKISVDAIRFGGFDGKMLLEDMGRIGLKYPG